MKQTKFIAAILAGMLIIASFALADTAANLGYTCYSVSVNSASTPVAVLPLNPPYKPSVWYVNERAANGSGTPAAANILVFPYVGTTVPTGVPSACASPTTTLTSGGCTEVTPTKPLNDAVGCDNSSCIGPIGQAWAAVLESGSTAVTVDSCMR